MMSATAWLRRQPCFGSAPLAGHVPESYGNCWIPDDALEYTRTRSACTNTHTTASFQTPPSKARVAHAHPQTRTREHTHARARTHARTHHCAWRRGSEGYAVVQLAVASKLNVTFPADQPGSSDPKARGGHARTHTHAHTRARAHTSACMPARTGRTGPQRGWGLLGRAAHSSAHVSAVCRSTYRNV